MKEHVNSRTLLLNGNVLTLDEHETRFEALAVEGGRILALGSTREIRALKRPGDSEVDLQGKTLMPGFIDTHCHIMSFGLNLKTWLGVPEVTTVEEIQKKLAERVRSTPWRRTGSKRFL